MASISDQFERDIQEAQQTFVFSIHHSDDSSLLEPTIIPKETAKALVKQILWMNKKKENRQFVAVSLSAENLFLPYTSKTESKIRKFTTSR